MEGILHSIESLAALDGDGLRSVVFLAGCPLRCAYCHNPDTWQMVGKRITAEALTKKICRFRPYFGSDGGVTFSGGEPLLQASFLEEMIPLLQKEGIGYIIDTSGHVPLSDSTKRVLAGSERVLLDLKFWDDSSYRHYTGQGIEPTLSMLTFLEEIGKKTTVRTVIVPEINDSESMLDRYLDCLRPYSCVDQYELLGFHTMGFFKYDQLGIPNPFSDKKPLDPHVLSRLQEYVKNNG